MNAASENNLVPCRPCAVKTSCLKAHCTCKKWPGFALWNKIILLTGSTTTHQPKVKTRTHAVRSVQIKKKKGDRRARLAGTQILAVALLSVSLGSETTSQSSRTVQLLLLSSLPNQRQTFTTMICSSWLAFKWLKKKKENLFEPFETVHHSLF